MIRSIIDGFRERYLRNIEAIESGKQLYFGSIEQGSEEDFEVIMDDLGFEIEWDEM